MPWQYVEGDETKQTMSQTAETKPQETKQEIYERNYGSTPAQQTAQPAPPPAQVTLPEELTSALGLIPALAEEVKTLKQQLAPPPPPPADPEEWVEKIRSGDFKGARQALFNEFKTSIDPELTRARNEAESRALQAMQIQSQIDNHLNQVRSANPDIVPYERYLKPLVEAAVAQDAQAGRIKTPEQYVSAYRRAAENEVETLRNLRLQERAGGKQEALTRSREVLSSTPLAPNQTSNRTPESGTEPVVDVSTPESRMDYITQRQQKLNRSRGNL